MKQRLLTTLALLCLGLTIVLGSIKPGNAQQETNPASTIARPLTLEQLLQSRPRQSQPVNPVDQAISSECALQPNPNPPPARSASVPINLPLTRFRQASANQVSTTTIGSSAKTPNYTPREEIALADLTNFGNRYLRDINGRSAVRDPIVVLHETVGSAQSAINFFQTPHPLDDDQVSYHTLVKEDGTVVYLVPPDKRAYGAGNSAFKGTNGVETVQTKLNYPPSVNNFAYHISLETPADGDNNNTSHSGYTDAQYQSLAWLVAKTGVPDSRITMHKLVDQSSSRMDPRSFDTPAFLRLLNSYPKTHEIVIGCTPPSEASLSDSQEN